MHWGDDVNEGWGCIGDRKAGGGLLGQAFLVDFFDLRSSYPLFFFFRSIYDVFVKGHVCIYHRLGKRLETPNPA